LLGAILFTLSALVLLGIGLLMGFAAFFAFTRGEPIPAQQTIFFLAFCFEASLLFVIAFFAFQKTLFKPSADRPASMTISGLQILAGMLLVTAAILIGREVGASERFNWLLLPILTIPAAVLPLVILFALGTQRLPLGTRWQSWSVLGLGMTLTPILLLALEAMLAILLLLVMIAYISTQPQLAHELEGLSRQIMDLGPQSQAAQELLSPWLTKPGVILTALIYMAVLVPAIEELLKPLGVWLLAGRLDSAAQGFSLGALSGAGYALIETIGVSGQVGEWASLLFTRIGTGLLHITTSALMGAAIVLAWRERRYMRLFGTYLLAVLLHGLWNAFAMLFTFSTLADLLDQPGPLASIRPWLIAVMSLLAISLFTLLILTNRKMRATFGLTQVEPTVPANQSDEIM